VAIDFARGVWDIESAKVFIDQGKGGFFLKRARKAGLSLLLLVVALTAAAGFSGLWTGQPVATAAGLGRLHAEPASILILAAGLAVLGLYARLKRAK